MLSDSSEPQSGTWCALAPSFAGSATNTTYLESTLTMLKYKLETGIEVVRDYDRSLPQLPAYAGELNQVWTNLVDNAVDAMDGMDGTGRLTVRTARHGDHLLVEIGDNGPGVPEAAAAHILEPFSTTKPVGKGTDLGLDIC
jgi:C4-dicarboxylate-specific signal transduction histidine kinase